MSTSTKSLPYQKILSDYSFPILVSLAFLFAFLAKGVVFNGLFMGIMITIALWVVVLKFPKWLKHLMAKHILLSDMLLTICTFGFLSSVGPGPTVLMASSTQAAITSVLLKTLPKK